MKPTHPVVITNEAMFSDVSLQILDGIILIAITLAIALGILLVQACIYWFQTRMLTLEQGGRCLAIYQCNTIGMMILGIFSIVFMITEVIFVIVFVLVRDA